jgi:hypothetical protein
VEIFQDFLAAAAETHILFSHRRRRLPKSFLAAAAAAEKDVGLHLYLPIPNDQFFLNN